MNENVPWWKAALSTKHLFIIIGIIVALQAIAPGFGRSVFVEIVTQMVVLLFLATGTRDLYNFIRSGRAQEHKRPQQPR